MSAWGQVRRKLSVVWLALGSCFVKHSIWFARMDSEVLEISSFTFFFFFCQNEAEPYC